MPVVPFHLVKSGLSNYVLPLDPVIVKQWQKSAACSLNLLQINCMSWKVLGMFQFTISCLFY